MDNERKPTPISRRRLLKSSVRGSASANPRLSQRRPDQPDRTLPVMTQTARSPRADAGFEVMHSLIGEAPCRHRELESIEPAGSLNPIVTCVGDGASFHTGLAGKT